jgi:hypothetical protein
MNAKSEQMIDAIGSHHHLMISPAAPRAEEE